MAYSTFLWSLGIFSPREIEEFDDRSIWSIVWSCFATIFACTWIAVHSNVPAPTDSRTRIFSRRFAIMGYVLLVPEMVILWVAHQYYGAKEIVDKYKGQGWTQTHAFFLLMGGFQLQENGVPIRALTVKEFDELYSAGRIDWPKISKEDIEDKSKADAFIKGIVLMQTGWFVLQCITRGAYKLAVTELEVVTLAFAALTTVIYTFWWHKPLDVGRAVPIELKPPEEDAEKLESAKASIISAKDVVPVASPAPNDSVSPTSDPPPHTQHISYPAPSGLGAHPQATPGMPSTEEATRSSDLLPPTSGVPLLEHLVSPSTPEQVTAAPLYDVEAGQLKAGAPTSTVSSPQATSARRTRYERFSGHVRHFRAFFRHQRHKRGLSSPSSTCSCTTPSASSSSHSRTCWSVQS
ncbi:unnamed protein product [Cyclocybe aegerita]|uniref:Uncharacterized protein n=1 Tax=Cyclocybe aegerita TaxID=1973307 RepID=A0A8S0XYF4_CYCAE|nr:unnamed protein product [Cyclocybe aegerita]